MNTPHELKTWPKFFQLQVDGKKMFELRLNDRDFMAGDLLILKEYDPDTNQYTGRELSFVINFVLYDKDFVGLQPGYCILEIIPDKNINTKTPITKWEHIDKCSGRLKNLLLSVRAGLKVFYNSEPYYQQYYIEDIDPNTLMKIRGFGRKTIDEFIKLRG